MADTIPGGLYIDERGFWINAEGQFIDKAGNVVSTPIKANAPKPKIEDEPPKAMTLDEYIATLPEDQQVAIREMFNRGASADSDNKSSSDDTQAPPPAVEFMAYSNAEVAPREDLDETRKPGRPRKAS